MPKDNVISVTKETIDSSLFSSAKPNNKNILLWIFVGISAVLLVALIITSSVLMSKNSNLQILVNSMTKDLEDSKKQAQEAKNELATLKTDTEKSSNIIETIKSREKLANDLESSNQKVHDLLKKLDDAVDKQDATEANSALNKLKQEASSYNSLLDQYNSFLKSNQAILIELGSNVQGTTKVIEDIKSTLNSQINDLTQVVASLQPPAGP